MYHIFTQRAHNPQSTGIKLKYEDRVDTFGTGRGRTAITASALFCLSRCLAPATARELHLVQPNTAHPVDCAAMQRMMQRMMQRAPSLHTIVNRRTAAAHARCHALTHSLPRPHGIVRRPSRPEPLHRLCARAHGPVVRPSSLARTAWARMLHLPAHLKRTHLKRTPSQAYYLKLHHEPTHITPPSLRHELHP